MVKELLKASIIGASIIVSTIIYSERNKYEFRDTDIGDYSVLNKRTGEVQSFYLAGSTTIRGTYYRNYFQRSTTNLDSDEAVLTRTHYTVIDSLNKDSYKYK